MVLPSRDVRNGVVSGEFDLGLAADEAALRRPDVNVALGCRYLSDLRRRFGANPALAVPAYNAGPGAVRARGLQYSSEPVIAYVRRVLAIYSRIQREAPLGGGSN